MLAIVVQALVPKEYSARTTITDEYKEIDIAVGLTKWEARFNATQMNKGINDMETYCQWLNTTEFARDICHSSDPDSIEYVKDNILYNLSSKRGTLTIQYTDRDPLKASQMLDSITSHLQNLVTEARQRMATERLKGAEKERREAAMAYHEAQERYARYKDSHYNSDLEEEKEEEKQLMQQEKFAYERYEKAAEKCVRHEVLSRRATCVFAVVESNKVPNEDNSHLATYLLPFLLISLALTKAYYLYKERAKEHATLEFGGIFSPWVITVAVWGGMLLFFCFWADELYPLTSQFYISGTLWISTFLISSFVTFNLLPHRTKPMPINGIEINKGFFFFFFALTVILSPLYLYKVYQIVSMFDSKNMLLNMRTLSVKGDGQGFLNYSYVLAQSLLLVALWVVPKIKKWMLAVIIGCCLMNAFAIMEKGMAFLVFISSMYVLFERRVIKIHTIIVLGALLVVVFFGINIMREGEESDYAKDETLLGFVCMYIMSPPVAFCQIMREATEQFGTNTFETLYLFLNRFGFNVEVHEKTQEFVYVPVSTNVYTIMQPFFRDFGHAGVAFFAWIYGMIAGGLYRLSCNANTTGICLYTYMVEILVLQFYQENIFLSMVLIIQTVFFVTLFTQKAVSLRIKK